MECVAQLKTRGHKDGCAPGLSLYSSQGNKRCPIAYLYDFNMMRFPGKARLAAHPVRPSDVRPPELQGRPQPHVSGGLQGQALGV